MLRDAFRLEIPAGHIHVPVMNNYYTGVPVLARRKALASYRFAAEPNCRRRRPTGR
ncbi:hypothetical protein [Pseudomonas aeruginosa]|uniref:hypothetical protein n=1 Tax=Pseudomonas aeruginosa TaxID=287 RepID=UPI00190FB60E|nr:hypothetical protein [Pseudomonas aeruginosa]